MNDASLAPAALERLSRETFVRSVEYYAELESTQDRAVECAGDPAVALPLLVLTARQTAGRGRGVRRWWASPGALTFSLVVDANTVPSVDARLSVATALAVRSALAELHPAGRFQVKWPNDVLLHGRKVAGILLDRPVSHLDRLVVGLGINVNNSLDPAPDDVRARGATLSAEIARPFRLGDVLKRVLLQLECVWHELADGRLDLPEAWAPHCRLQGRRVTVLQGSRTVDGVCHGVDAMGNLLIDGPNGLVAMASGTVTRP